MGNFGTVEGNIAVRNNYLDISYVGIWLNQITVPSSLKNDFTMPLYFENLMNYEEN